MDHWDPLMTDGLATGREVILFNGRGVASSIGKPRKDFLSLFFSRSGAAKRAGRDFWNRRHQRADQDPPSSPDVIQAQIEASMHYLPKLDPQAPFAHLREITQPTFVMNGVVDVMIPTINSWHMVQNIPNAQLFVYPDAGHGVQFQYPKRFLGHAIQFLDGE